MNKQIIATKNAPGAIGPYSQGIKKGNFIFVSGQLPINSVTGEMPVSIQEQTRQSLNNVTAILKEAGASLENVIKTTVFLKDLAYFSEFNEVYQQFFENDYPSRSCVEVARLPKDAGVEIEVIAITD